VELPHVLVRNAPLGCEPLELPRREEGIELARERHLHDGSKQVRQ
jgi:hypothetical protein